MRAQLNWQHAAVAFCNSATACLGSDARKWHRALSNLVRAPLMLEQHARKRWLDSSPAGVQRDTAALTTTLTTIVCE